MWSLEGRLGLFHGPESASSDPFPAQNALGSSLHLAVTRVPGSEEAGRLQHCLRRLVPSLFPGAAAPGYDQHRVRDLPASSWGSCQVICAPADTCPASGRRQPVPCSGSLSSEPGPGTGREASRANRETDSGGSTGRAEGWLWGKAPGAVLGVPCLRRGERALVAETRAHAQVGDGRAVCQAPSEGRRPRGRVPRFRDTAESLLLALPLSLAQLVRTQ